MDAHTLVSIVKEEAEIGGKRPTLHQILARGATESQIRKYFGSFSALIKAAGLKPYHDGTLRDDSGVYVPPIPQSIQEKIDEYVPREFKSPSLSKKILVIGDTHFPFVHKACLEAIIDFCGKHRPDYIVQAGDLLDLYAHSKFPRSLNTYGPEEEEQVGIEGARDMWRRLKIASPASKCFQLLGNHDIRPMKRVLEVAPGFEHIVKAHYKNLMQFDGVETIDDYRQELIIDGIIFHHGYRSKLGDHRDYVRQNFVCGHSHKGGVVFRRMRDETIWELNAGFVGDADAKALSYTAQKIHDQTLGWGYIDEFGPRFIAL